MLLNKTNTIGTYASQPEANFMNLFEFLRSFFLRRLTMNYWNIRFNNVKDMKICKHIMNNTRYHTTKTIPERQQSYTKICKKSWIWTCKHMLLTKNRKIALKITKYFEMLHTGRYPMQARKLVRNLQIRKNDQTVDLNWSRLGIYRNAWQLLGISVHLELVSKQRNRDWIRRKSHKMLKLHGYRSL